MKIKDQSQNYQITAKNSVTAGYQETFCIELEVSSTSTNKKAIITKEISVTQNPVDCSKALVPKSSEGIKLKTLSYQPTATEDEVLQDYETIFNRKLSLNCPIIEVNLKTVGCLSPLAPQQNIVIKDLKVLGIQNNP